MQSSWLNLSEKQYRVHQLVRSGKTFAEARKEVYGRKTYKKVMPEFLIDELRSYVKSGYSRSWAIKRCGVSEASVYQWAKTNDELAAVLRLARKKFTSSIIGHAAALAQGQIK